jgi:hypothetical protein
MQVGGSGILLKRMKGEKLAGEIHFFRALLINSGQKLIGKIVPYGYDYRTVRLR